MLEIVSDKQIIKINLLFLIQIIVKKNQFLKSCQRKLIIKAW